MKLKPETEFLFNEIAKMIQGAEEMSGPEGAEYIRLMIAICNEANSRIEGLLSWWPEKKSPPMTLEKFRLSGRNVRFHDHKGLSDMQGFGRVYDGNCAIQLCDDGEWLLMICNSEWKDSNLAALEKRLYEEWYLKELT